MVIALVQARLGSHRFPRKILADLAGKPVIHHVASRALQIAGVDRVIVAVPSWGEMMQIAPVLPEDERLSVMAPLGCDEDDVLADLYDLCRSHHRGREPNDSEGITLFKSVGAALEDLAAAELAVEMT